MTQDNQAIALLDSIDKLIINQLQGGFPLSDEPYKEVAEKFAISEDELLERIERLLSEKVLSRFGPMYDIQKLGGAFSLCAMRVPEPDFDKITEQVNSFEEVAHNYKRDNEFNMWFVLACEKPEQIQECCDNIEQKTGIKVYNMPKLKEFFVGLHFSV